MWNRIHALAANTNATDTIHAMVIGRKSSLMIVPTVFSMHSTRNNRLRTVIKHRQLAYMTANAVSNGRAIRIRICPARISLSPCKSPALSSLKLNCFRLLPVRLPNAVDRQHQVARGGGSRIPVGTNNKNGCSPTMLHLRGCGISESTDLRFTTRP